MTDMSDFTENSLENNENSNASQDEIDLEGDVSQNDGTSDDVLDTANTENDTELPSVIGEEPSEKILRLPLSRVKKIMKMDPDVSIASQEAVFLITKATELLLDSLAKEAYSFTASENKKTVSKKHLDSAINSIDALAFLDGALE